MEGHSAHWSAATAVFLTGCSNQAGPKPEKKEIFHILQISSVREELNTGHLWGRLWPIVSI